ncbi:hypothetical protein C8J57DRAFT_375424 [Mycena rebaudengoi]|nr:hypothetical protein C8J57DRAFT_375424 [Mycena rebaudengoi]
MLWTHMCTAYYLKRTTVTVTTMSTVYQLPDELLDHIMSFISEEHYLWALCRVSSRFRRLAIPLFLSCFYITASDIQAGTITLARSFFVILVVANINPIRRLVISDMINHLNLASVLSVAAPIPDIVIYNNMNFLFRWSQGVLYVLSCIPRPLLIVKHDSMIVSYYRAPRPRRWDLPCLRLSELPSTRNKIEKVVIWGIPLVVHFFIWLILGCWTMITWTYRRIFGPPWVQVFRIVEDLGRLYGSHWIRIQTLPTAAGDFALVTIACESPEQFRFMFWHIPNLAPEVYAVLLATLELQDHFTSLRVREKTGLSHSDLLGFLQRHPRVSNLTFDQNSLDPSSFVARWNIPQTVRVLTAPASYIPKLLPTQPNLAQIEITFPFTTTRDKHVTGAFDLPGYYEALDAVASLPGTEPISLTLTLPVTATTLPWLNIADASMLSGNSRPETRLHCVQHLGLASQTILAFRAAALQDLLPPWLALFPALTHVHFRLMCVATTSAVRWRELAQAIVDACPFIVQPENVIIDREL